MPANTSKQSSDRMKMARFVLAALLLRGREIADLLCQTFLPHCQEGDPAPDFFGPIIALGRKLKDAIDRVVAADNRLFAANTALETARQARNETTRRLSRQIIGLRGACSALFVDLPVQQLGFDARTAQDPVPLLIQADRVVEHLEGDDVAESERLFEDDDFEPTKYAKQVGKTAQQLRDDLDEVATNRREAEKELLAKRAVTRKYDDLFLHGARMFESYCRLAGETELADRIRESDARPSRSEAKPDEETESGPGAPTAGEEGASGSETQAESAAPSS